MEFLKRLERRKHYISVASHVRASPHSFLCVLYILVLFRSRVIRSSLPFLLPISMLAIFGTPHKCNVLLANFLVYVSAPTLLIMDFTILGQIVARAMRLTSACFPTIESLMVN